MFCKRTDSCCFVCVCVCVVPTFTAGTMGTRALHLSIDIDWLKIDTYLRKTVVVGGGAPP